MQLNLQEDICKMSDFWCFPLTRVLGIDASDILGPLHLSGRLTTYLLCSAAKHGSESLCGRRILATSVTT